MVPMLLAPAVAYRTRHTSTWQAYRKFHRPRRRQTWRPSPCCWVLAETDSFRPPGGVASVPTEPVHRRREEASMIADREVTVGHLQDPTRRSQQTTARDETAAAESATAWRRRRQRRR